jgi:hypothetical protein
MNINRQITYKTGNMKKILGTGLFVIMGFIVNAQDDAGRAREAKMEIVRICASIFAVGLFMLFFLSILKRILDHRLKNKIIEKGISESVAASVLRPTSDEDRNINVKWFMLLAGIGTGLIIVYYTQPLDIHSLAIMAFSVSMSFLGYYLFLRFAEKKS